MAASSSTTCYAKFLLILVAIISFSTNSCFAARNLINAPQTSTEFIKTSCGRTTYPTLCYTSLSVRSSQIQTSPRLLASAALDVSLLSAKSTSATMLKLAHTPGITARQAGAMRDCVEELSDSVDAIKRSIDAMNTARGSDFQLMINDVQTWVSAALTDESTCSDGFAGNSMNGNLKVAVRGQIVNIAHLTSNALALINHYASFHG